jgi:hypothetical protein
MEAAMPNLVIRPTLARPINTLAPNRPVLRSPQSTALDTFTPAPVNSLVNANNTVQLSSQQSAATGIGGFFSNLFSSAKHWLGGLLGQAEDKLNQAEPGLVTQGTGWLSNLLGGFATKALSWLDGLLSKAQNTLDP